MTLDKPRLKRKCVTYRQFKKMDLKAFHDDLSKSELAMPCSPGSSAEVLVTTFNNTAAAILDVHAPLCSRSIVLKPFLPWWSEEIIQARCTRRRLERKWRKTKLESDKRVFLEQMKCFQLLLRSTKECHFDTLVTENSGDPRKLWKVLNDMLHRGRDCLLPGSVPANILAERFSTFFKEKIDRLHSSLCKNGSTLPGSSPTTTPSYLLSQFEPTNCAEIEKLLRSAPAKSSPIDVLPTWLLKGSVDILLPRIVDIVNAALAEGMPISYKRAVVTPLLKNASLDINVLNNFRPVSNLSYISKLIERIVARRLIDFVESNSLLEPCQSAYRRFHSTETAMLRVQHDLLMASEKQHVSALVLLDLSAAFDTVEHATLLQRLSMLGLTGSALEWIQSYLSDRYQCVQIEGFLSANVQVKTGVPQGSVLGPILFILFTHELGQLIRSHGFECHFYADDTQIYGSFAVEDVKHFILRLEKCLDDVLHWMSNSSLCLNDSKTEILLTATSAQLRRLEIPSVRIGSALILPTSSTRVLGVNLEGSMKMDGHVKAICKGGWYHLRTISKIRSSLSKQTCELLVHAFITSRIDLCNGLLSGATKKNLNRLQRLFNASARVVCLSPKRDPITPVLRSLHWLKVPERIDFKIALLVFKVLQGVAPVYLRQLVKVHEPSRSLRSSSCGPLIERPLTRLRTTEGAFGVAAARVWNSLPLSVRSAVTLGDFKTRLKTYLFTRSYT
jgi:hypothetical protein